MSDTAAALLADALTPEEIAEGHRLCQEWVETGDPEPRDAVIRWLWNYRNRLLAAAECTSREDKALIGDLVGRLTGHRIAAKKQAERLAEMERQLEWYGEQAEALARYMTGGKPNWKIDAIEAVLIALSLDAGKRAGYASRHPKESEPT